MWLTEVIIDGFKSYAAREVVSGFDMSFNAITGLNGTGKSNILDAICFVLGITNLTQVRVSNLQQLVYKQGQAGVTKASVTLVFNNEDKERSPIGYQQFNTITITRQVVIGGRNKYLINGHNARGNQIQTLFHSVQLNVNNPHFLIMQGKITQVLNMKPPEILSMVEEAAGTRMFEMKKQTALRTIDKKDSKLQEINRVLEEEIVPTMERLREDRDTYNKWTANKNAKERLLRFVIAYAYMKAEKILQGGNIKEIEAKLEEVLRSKEEDLQRISDITDEIEALGKKKEKQMKKECQALEKEADELSKKWVAAQGEFDHKKSALEEAEGRKKGLEKQAAAADKAVEKLQATIEKMTLDKQGMEERNNKLSTAYVAYQRAYQANNASLATNAEEAGGKTLAEQLIDAQKQATDAATEIKSAKLKIEHLEKEIQAKSKHLQSMGGDSKKLEKEREAALRECEKLRAALKTLGYDDNAESGLLQERKNTERKVMELREKVADLTARFSHIQLDYRDPVPNFDKSRVKGLVINLLKVKDPKATTALEVTAGGRLYNVVVDTEETGALLIKKGQLKKRVTIIPLNQVAARRLTPNVIAAAEKIVGKENVTHAIQLIGYDKEVETAMNYVFGSTLVCSDSTAAERVTFNKTVNARSVTLDGVVFDPAGTLTGGSRPQAASLLEQLQRLNGMKDQLAEEKHKLQKLDGDFAKTRESSREYQKLKEALDIKSHEAELLAARLQQCEHSRMIEEIEAAREQVIQSREALKAAAQKEADADAKAKQIESAMSKSSGRSQKDEMKVIHEKMVTTKASLGDATKSIKQHDEKIEQAELELEQLKKEQNELLEKIRECESEIKKLQKELHAMEHGKGGVAEKRAAYEAAQERLQKKQESVLSTDERIAGLLQEKDDRTQASIEREQKLKKLQNKVKRFHKDKEDAKKYCAQAEKSHDFILKEKQFFGNPDSAFDFQKNNPEEAERRLQKIEQEQEKLKKVLNSKVMNMFEKADEEYKELTKKKVQIEKDKAKLMAVISELDEKKNEALEKTYVKVNKDFGSIFSTLLKGAEARLEPPEGETVLDGLKMRVAFGGMWKNLTELSGGQKSLLALSLILSLLLFKPAPMYILDEIDAALDLSHTENIGRMLQKHFRFSQFIIVSLKEGMWKNANVVFKTKFVDGTSRVTRHVPTKAITDGTNRQKKKTKASATASTNA